jgi:hypothetical protein
MERGRKTHASHASKSATNDLLRFRDAKAQTMAYPHLARRRSPALYESIS